MKKETLKKMLRGLKEAMSAPRVHIVNGNKKIGSIPHFSTLMGGDNERIYTNGAYGVIGGTCGNCEECKSVCYARNETRYPSALVARTHNTNIVKNDLLTLYNGVVDYVTRKNCDSFRWNASGEIYSADMFIIMCAIAKKCPNCQFFTYTKRFDLLEEYAQAIPENLHISASIWHKNYNNPLGFAEFIYDDGTEPELVNIVHCPAVDKNGKKTKVTCKMCGRCVRATKGQKTAVYAH